jgi:Group II intron, maturase-specific domain
MAIKATVRALTRGMTNHPLKVLLHQLNPVLWGWTSYFRHGVSKATFSYLRAFVWRRVVGWLRRKHPRSNWKQLRRRYLPGWWPTDGEVALLNPAAVTVTRYRYRAAYIPSPWTSGRTGRSRSRPEGLVESPMRRRGARPVRRRGPGKRTARKGGAAPRLDPTGSRCCR